MIFRWLITNVLLFILASYASQSWMVWNQPAVLGLSVLYYAWVGLAFFGVNLMLFVPARFRNRVAIRYLQALAIGVILSMILMSLMLLLEDLWRLIYWISGWMGSWDQHLDRHAAWSGITLGAGIGLFALLVYGMIRNPYRYRIHKVAVHIPEWPEALHDLRIIQLSDIHSGSFFRKQPLERIAEKINQLNPDLILFTGDLVNNVASEIDPYMGVFGSLRAKYGIYSVLGNHDYGDYVQWPNPQTKADNFNQLLEAHRKMGWDILLNENRLISIEGHLIALIGVENYSANRRFAKYGDLSKAYQGIPSQVPKILLSHDPSHWLDEVVPKFQDIALTLSGHTHGMQFGIDIPGLIQWSPVKYVYRQWIGLYQKGRQYLYVNRGFGFLGYPGRVGVLAEVTHFVIQTKESFKQNKGTSHNELS